MSSIIEGYNYDIFISYRQKDNKYDGWVTKFVDNLKKELEATFKEQVSVYFDINPSDYLLESYDVDASLKDKLKCLVFIPILSRTYCDSKSFAWVNEFNAFVQQASNDQYGLKVKLPNGNVASRVLPVKIHDLDPSDIKECESVLGGVLRGIEFIYKEAGIDKPLAPDDDEKKNLNNTKYRIQIIKVAHAIKEIISGLKTEPTELGKEKTQLFDHLEETRKDDIKEVQVKPVKLSKRKFLISVAILVILIIAVLFVYPKLFKRYTIENIRAKGKISIVVFPFQNMTNDTTWDIWQDGIKDELISFLTNYNEELNVKQTESINSLIKSKNITNYGSITISVASKIAQKLDAKVFVNGSIKQAGDKIRVNSSIIDSKTKEGLRSFQIDETNKEEMIFQIIDSLKKMLKDYLIISKISKNLYPDWQNYVLTTSSAEAFKSFNDGLTAYNNLDMTSSIKCFKQAVAIDTNYAKAMEWVATVYNQLGLYEDAKKWIIKADQKKDKMSPSNQIWLNWKYAQIFGTTPGEPIKYLKQLLDMNEQTPGVYSQLGNEYYKINQYDNAISGWEKALELDKKLDIKPYNWVYSRLAESYHNTKQYKKEKKLYEQYEKDFPDDPNLFYRQAVLSLTEGDTKEANENIEKYKSIHKDKLASEAAITTGLAQIYSAAGILDIAERYYRNAGNMNNLAYFLIDKDRDIYKGLELADTLLKRSPDNYTLLDIKGWGLYKQGKYQEASDLLDKSWKIRREKAIYNHEAWLHLEAARKAVAEQKNN